MTCSLLLVLLTFLSSCFCFLGVFFVFCPNSFCNDQCYYVIIIVIFIMLLLFVFGFRMSEVILEWHGYKRVQLGVLLWSQ